MFVVSGGFVADGDHSELKAILRTLLGEVQQIQVDLAVLSRAHFSDATLCDLSVARADAETAVYERTQELVRKIEAL
jgi:hypothetical protein